MNKYEENKAITEPDYSQISMSNQVNSSNKSQNLFEQLKYSLHEDLINENTILKKENAELKGTIQKQNSTIVDQANELYEYKKKLRHAQEIIRTYEECKRTGDPRPMFDYVYDMSDYEKEMETKDVETFWDNMLTIINISLPDGTYLVNCAAAVVPIYLVLTKGSNIVKSKWHYKGTMADFCTCWNKNIVPRIEDPERAKQLTINYDNFKKEANRAPWKNSIPASWRRILDEGDSNKKKLKRAINIKSQVEKMYA